MANIIHSFDRASIKVLGEELQAAIETVARRHGLQCHKRGGKFSEQSFSPHFELCATNEKGESPSQVYFKQYASLFGLKPEWLGRKIVLSGTPYEITGMRDTRGRSPVIIRRIRDNKEFRCSADIVRSNIEES